MGPMSALTEAKAKLRRARTRRRRASTPTKADSALRVIRRLREDIRTIKARVRPNPCTPPGATYHSAKGWDRRPVIAPRLLVLHSTESAPGSAKGVAGFLANAKTQADVHVIIDSDGFKIRLVPDARKAWHVMNYNSAALGIEQVGRAAQASWPDAQLHAVAKQLACWSRKYRIPLVDARSNPNGGRGVVTHSSLGATGGGHADPGTNYPFQRVLALARKYR